MGNSKRTLKARSFRQSPINYIFLLQKIRKELIDARVVEGHIVPNRLLFTSHAPSQEYPTVAWLRDGIQAILFLVCGIARSESV